MNASFRRPAQLTPEQLEDVASDVNIEASLELAHVTAQAFVNYESAVDESAISRVRAVVADEGIDTIAQAWAQAPEDTVPGILWRGYLLREWIRRFPDDSRTRFAAAQAAGIPSNGVCEPATLRDMWDEVFEGDFAGDFVDVLRQSARLTDFLARVEPLWIDDDDHPLATLVTRRDTALAKTAQEFHDMGEKLHGRMPA